jgi:hypothetical protein
VNAALTNGPAIAISALWRFGDKNLKVARSAMSAVFIFVFVFVFDFVFVFVFVAAWLDVQHCRTSISKTSSWADASARWRYLNQEQEAM